MFCDQCGQAMANEARFCARCGKAVTVAVEPAPGIPVEAPPFQTPDPVSDPPPVAPPGLTAAEHQKLQEFVSTGLLDGCRKRVTGDRRASDTEFLDALIGRATAEPSFHTALAYSMATVDFLPLERFLDHPDLGLPRAITQWAQARSAAGDGAGAESHPGSARQLDQAVGPTCPPGQRLVYAAPPTNGFAIASLVLGILWLWCVGSVLALIFGYISVRQIKERGEGGRGMAIAGIVLGWVGVALAVILILIVVSLSAATNSTPSYR